MSVTLQWEPPTDNGGRPVLGYVIEMKDKFSPDWIEVLLSTDVPDIYTSKDPIHILAIAPTDFFSIKNTEGRKILKGLPKHICNCNVHCITR